MVYEADITNAKHSLTSLGAGLAGSLTASSFRMHELQTTSVSVMRLALLVSSVFSQAPTKQNKRTLWLYIISNSLSILSFIFNCFLAGKHKQH